MLDLRCLRFNNVNIVPVKQPDTTVINISIGATTISGMMLKINPVPRLYRCPYNKIISPIYISSVNIEATIDGTQIETNLRLLVTHRKLIQ